MVTAELGVNALQGRVTVGLGLLDAVFVEKENISHVALVSSLVLFRSLFELSNSIPFLENHFHPPQSRYDPQVPGSKRKRNSRGFAK